MIAVEPHLGDRTETMILGHPLGRDDDFFEAGGHSLNALRASSRIARALQVAVTVRDLFQVETYPTLHAMVSTVTARKRSENLQDVPISITALDAAASVWGDRRGADLNTFDTRLSRGVNLGVLPTKGIALPLISAGGSSLLINLVGMGVLLNISQHEALDV